MKLGIEHLAPYLPYELNCEFNDYGLKKIKPLVGVVSDRYFRMLDDGSGTFSGSIENCKPLLRPLSQLKDLMPNGDVCYISDLWYNVIATDSDCFDKDIFFENCDLGNIEHLPIKVYNQLLKWHFDVFSLCKQNLALPIPNTTKTK